jgi:hypothetical protein
VALHLVVDLGELGVDSPWLIANLVGLGAYPILLWFCLCRGWFYARDLGSASLGWCEADFC